MEGYLRITVTLLQPENIVYFGLDSASNPFPADYRAGTVTRPDVVVLAEKKLAAY